MKNQNMKNLKNLKNQIIASSPGHIRIKIPELYQSHSTKIKVETNISRCKYVIAVYATTLTGRVLIIFDPHIPIDTLLSELGFSNKSSNTAPTSQRKEPHPPWHAYDADTALTFFGSSPRSGLPQNFVDERLRDGLNLLTQQKPVSSLHILLNQFKSVPILLLGISAALSALTGGLAEAAAIISVLALNSGIGFVSERRAESTIASLSELVDNIVPVLRDGKVHQAEASHIVPGDVLILAPGIRIAADIRLLQADNLSIDESALTGESMPVSKSCMALDPATVLADRINMAYRGTAVSMGTGLGLVVGTGDNTEIGAIQSMMTNTVHPRTPIQNQLDQLGNQLVMISCTMCAGIFVLGLLRGNNWLQMFKASISLAIAAVPEGLPAVATTSLARGIRQMRDKKVLIRRLHAVETIGTIQTICLDKTGTLTMNHMSAVEIRTCSLRMDSLDTQIHMPHMLHTKTKTLNTELGRLLQICVLCNQSEPGGGSRHPSLNGSATENALIDLAAQAGILAEHMRERFPLQATELRAEGRNYMRTIHAMPGSTQSLIAVKGAPLEVLNLCEFYQASERTLALNETVKADIVRQNQQMGEQQLRVLGFAYAEAAHMPSQPSLVWVGLIGLADPLRPGVEHVIDSFHRAGIRPVMLTGDQAATASVIGQSLHLNEADIFSRVSPSNKLQIVQSLQQNGETVAMTGDGINDGPALRAANIGIAMGNGGTDLARSAADIVLKDDQLETLLEAIRQGRTISSNIRKSLHFLISSNLSEILVVFGSTLIGRSQSLTPMQLLWLNLLTDVLPAIALTAEPSEVDVMTQAPRNPQSPLVGKNELRRYAQEGSCLAGGALSAYLYGSLRYGAGEHASAVAFNSLVLGQLLHAVSCRSDHHHAFFDRDVKPNRQMTLAVGASIGLQLLANLIPGLRRLLGLAPMNIMDMVATAACAAVPLVLNAPRPLPPQQPA